MSKFLRAPHLLGKASHCPVALVSGSSIGFGVSHWFRGLPLVLGSPFGFRVSLWLRGPWWKVRGGSCRVGINSLFEDCCKEAFVEEVTPELGFEG